ncbi:MAG: hypothetical protein AAGL10_08975 [Pseudomonadota bacterium]
MRRVIPATAVLCLSACAQSDDISRDAEPFGGIAESEVITAMGTEPFWSVKITGDKATFSNPENSQGEPFAVSRFAGNNGLGFSGELDGQSFTLTVTLGDCSDGMSDRTFPYTATLSWGGETVFGCAYTDIQSYTQ